MSSIIEINNLSAFYGPKQILNSINLNIKQNKITAIIGPSGCGKSTFLKTLNLLALEENDFHYNGDIKIENRSIKSIPRENLRKNVGLVFQQPTCFPFSIYKNMSYALNYHTDYTKKEIDSLIIENLKLTGLYDEISENLQISALKLSGGQQQRLCIARTLAIKPKILLLDEPCSALDINNSRIIEDLLIKLSCEYTIVIVTHNLNQAKRISDYTAFFLDGKLVEYGKTSNIFNNPIQIDTQNYIQGIYG